MNEFRKNNPTPIDRGPDSQSQVLLKDDLHRMLGHFLRDIEDEQWIGKERELINRFAFSVLVPNAGCCPDFSTPRQIGIGVRVKQLRPGQTDVCKDLILWKYPFQTVWSQDPVPRCIIEWQHNKRKPAENDINWLREYTTHYPDCFGIALNIDTDPDYSIRATLVEEGKIQTDWLSG